jgi:hypothetical protein
MSSFMPKGAGFFTTGFLDGTMDAVDSQPLFEFTFPGLWFRYRPTTSTPG